MVVNRSWNCIDCDMGNIIKRGRFRLHWLTWIVVLVAIAGMVMLQFDLPDNGSTSPYLALLQGNGWPFEWQQRLLPAIQDLGYTPPELSTFSIPAFVLDAVCWLTIVAALILVLQSNLLFSERRVTFTIKGLLLFTTICAISISVGRTLWDPSSFNNWLFSSLPDSGLYIRSMHSTLYFAKLAPVMIGIGCALWCLGCAFFKSAQTALSISRI
jgi:hypothetical protein